MSVPGARPRATSSARPGTCGAPSTPLPTCADPSAPLQSTTGSGSFCVLTGSAYERQQRQATRSARQLQPKDRRRALAPKSTTRRAPQPRTRPHAVAVHPGSITTALRKIFSSPAYQAFIDKERNRRKLFIAAAIGKHRKRRLTLPEIALLAREATQRFAGAAKSTLPITDCRLELIRESLIVFARGGLNEKPLLSIKSTAAYVAAVLTLLSTGLEVDGHTAFPKLPWLRAYLPPPVAMTAVGVPRSVSLAVRQLSTCSGPTSGRHHFFKVSKSLVSGALAVP